MAWLGNGVGSGELYCFAVLLRPRPPNLVGRAKISLSVSLGGGLPVMVGMNTVRRMFSSG